MENTTANELVNLEGLMKHMREELKGWGERILQIKLDLKDAPIIGVEDRGEEIANLMLAYRHMEDCIMRLGKVIQAFNGGENPLMPKTMGVVSGPEKV